MQTTTRLDDALLVMGELGEVTYPVRIGGETIDRITLTIDRDWVEDESEGYRFAIQGDDYANDTDDWDEARDMVAEAIRAARNGWMDERSDRDNDSARDAVEGLIDSGKAADVLKALKAAGLL